MILPIGKSKIQSPLIKTTYPMVSLLFIILLSIISLFINDLISIWFILEANNFAFLFLITLDIKNKKIIFIYYLIQIISSSLIVISVLINLLLNYSASLILDIILITGLILKIGVPPLHSWLPALCLFIKWNIIIIILTIQKVIPFIILSIAHPHTSLQTIFVLICLIIPPYLILNSTNLKKLITYSSINQSGWIIIISLSFRSLWVIYIIIYSISLMLIKTIIKEKKIKFNIKIRAQHNTLYLLTIIIIMNLAGIPPLTLFVFKWYAVIRLIILTKPNIIIIIILIRSLIIVYLYTNILVKISLIKYPNSKIWITQSPNLTIKKFLILSALILSIIIFII